MKKEAKEKAMQYFIDLLEVETGEKDLKESLRLIFNEFSEYYYYEMMDDKERNYQFQFTKWILNYRGFIIYNSDRVNALVSFGYPEKDSRGNEWPDYKVDHLLGYILFETFKTLCEQYNFEVFDIFNRYEHPRYYYQEPYYIDRENPLKMLKNPYIETVNGLLGIIYKKGWLHCGSITNAGILYEYSVSYDFEKTLDENLEKLCEEISKKEEIL